MRSSWWSMGFLWCGFANTTVLYFQACFLLKCEHKSYGPWYVCYDELKAIGYVLDAQRNSMISFLQLSHDHRPTHLNIVHHNSPESSANVRCKDHTFLIPICTLRNVLTFMAIGSCRLLPSSI
ncbi:uncharacterized protein BJ212DRAFT_617537 [Suillus subaureus]|uniref:Uncharacterized protein n=1 Tax=Suillus subaureus TaxID=48587 RepID=A0A9P7J952_9AGAM|nr:uncharacterized protein BJ212DRAFT_617537 [Suillus subaureus]KAG1809134.1 hypothetical protein BJ212DRAFT_617537 [Suillus subaureus]